ncbi:hypothetical protein DFP72DRAFT_860670 [Ephemerocybe angulata]|uniref:Uncharacterized protein n=1 Tax=Ephemerocybe angulata TaxID=980116 RepID=A0A8H6H839_9AGAR|nr:hypothetical protein DFP72DRAFT_860670 [Tulosesus angulatus]
MAKFSSLHNPEKELRPKYLTVKQVRLPWKIVGRSLPWKKSGKEGRRVGRMEEEGEGWKKSGKKTALEEEWEGWKWKKSGKNIALEEVVGRSVAWKKSGKKALLEEKWEEGFVGKKAGKSLLWKKSGKGNLGEAL